MKKYSLLALAAVLFSVSLCAQEDTSSEFNGAIEALKDAILREKDAILEEADAKNKEEQEKGSSVLYDGSAYNFIFSWKKKATKAHWNGLGFAFSNWNELEGADLQLNQSYSVVLNLVDYIVPLDHHWLLTTGLGFDWSRYHFKGDVGLREQDGVTQFLPNSEGLKYRDSKFIAYYATIPILLEYQTKAGGKTIFMYGGVEGMLNLYSKSQVEVRTPDGIKKVHNKGLNVLPLNYRFTARIGLDDISLFGYYQPNSPFQKGKGPDVQPYGIGIMLNF